MIKSWLIQHGDTQVFLRSVGLRHLEERVHLTDCWNVVWNEGLQLRLQVDLLRLVPVDVLEDLLNVGRNLEICVHGGVIGAWDFLLFVVIFIIFLWRLTRHLLLSRLLLLLLGLVRLRWDVNVYIDLVFLLV